MTWDRKWYKSDRWYDWVSPYEDSEDKIRFTYWWEDMKPREVRELVQEAYETGYERGLEDSRVEIERLREGVECHIARPGEGTYECNINKPCPACRLRVAEKLVRELRDELKAEQNYSEWLSLRIDQR
jgi:hypothetical protein